MADPATRLRASRIRAGFETVEDACRRFGWKSPGVRHHDNGTRAFFDIEAAQRYAKAYRVEVPYLLGLSDFQPAADLPGAAEFSEILALLFDAIAPDQKPPAPVLQALGAALADTVAEPDPATAAGTVGRMIARRTVRSISQ